MDKLTFQDWKTIQTRLNDNELDEDLKMDIKALFDYYVPAIK